MIDILNRFLIQNKSISIPGLGTIHAERIPARLNTESLLVAPSYRFRFDKYFDAPDKNFFTYLSMQKQIPDYEAIRLYNQFAQDFRSGIMLEEKLQWDEIGYFQKNNSGEVEFFQTGNNKEEFIELPAVVEPATALSVAISQPEAEDAVLTEVITTDEITIEEIETTGELDAAELQTAHPLEKPLYYTALGLLALGLLAAGLQFGKYGFNAKAWANRQNFTLVKP